MVQNGTVQDENLIRQLNTLTVDDKNSPKFMVNSDGVPVGLSGARGGMLVDANLSYPIPSGMSWLTDTISGFDIYSRGFYQSPTCFYDPQATGSLNWGTYRQPYNNIASVIGTFSGFQGGKVLGVKRGSITRDYFTSALAFNFYGANGDPAFIVPYGDQLALPAWYGSVVTTTWVPTGGYIGVYQATVTSQEVDAIENGVRLYKVASLAALSATSGGYSYFTGTTLYIKPYNGSVSPNLGQIEVQTKNSGLRVTYSDVADTGNIVIAGQQVGRCFNIGLNVVAAGTSWTSCNNIKIVGCNMTLCGFDQAGVASTLSRAGASIYGYSTSQRITNLYYAGNYTDNTVNNALEIAFTGSATIEYNNSYNVTGNSIVELWASNSNTVVRYNYGIGRGNRPWGVTGFHDAAIWMPGQSLDGGLVPDSQQNLNNEIYYNVSFDTKNYCIDIRAGQAKIYNNTMFMSQTPNTSTYCAQFGDLTFVAGTVAETAYIQHESNYYYCYGTTNYGQLICDNAFTNYNVNANPGGSNIWDCNGASSYNTYVVKSDFSTQSSFTQGSYATYNGATYLNGRDGGGLMSLSLAAPPNTRTDAAGRPVGASALLNNGHLRVTMYDTRKDNDGKYVSSTPSIGAYQSVPGT